MVLGLPRGGIPVAFQVAQALGAPLEVIVVRKLERPSPVQAGIAIAGTVDSWRRSEEVGLTVGAVWLAGYTSVPEGARGSWCSPMAAAASRHSPRNRHVAYVLNDAGLGTLLFDLLTREEEGDRANVFDMWLARRAPGPGDQVEPGTLDAAGGLARDWFLSHFPRGLASNG